MRRLSWTYIKHRVTRVPVVDQLVRRIWHNTSSRSKPFPGSSSYWEHRYQAGGTSGHGSYNELATFKARVLNSFVIENRIETVIEYGCGDGNQLRLAKYPSYIGFDVSPKAVSMCQDLFHADDTKEFRLMSEFRNDMAELTLSLDVIYHLVEDEVFSDYMNRLFDSAARFVIIYSSDSDQTPEDTAAHVRHRNFSGWLEEHKPEWRLAMHIPNRHPFNGDTRTGSFADFYIYEKVAEKSGT